MNGNGPGAGRSVLGPLLKEGLREIEQVGFFWG